MLLDKQPKQYLGDDLVPDFLLDDSSYKGFLLEGVLEEPK